MAKHVVPSYEVAHIWAHQALDYANNGRNGNVSFTGTVLSSYSTPIANIVTDRNKQRVALISSTGYSSSTGKHINYAHRAIGYEARVMPVYVVPFIGATGGRAPYIGDGFGRSRATDPKEFHAANVSWLLKSYSDDYAKAHRARDPEWYQERLANYVRIAREYADRFLLAHDRRKIKFPDVAADWQKVAEKIAARSTPEAIAKREKESEQRHARAVRDFREVRGKYGVDYREPWRFRHEFSDDDKAARAANLAVYWQRYVAEHREQFRTQWQWHPACDSSQFSDDDRATRRQAESAWWRDYVETSRESFRTDPRFYPQCSPELFSDDDRATRAALLERIEQERKAERARIDAERLAAWLRGESVSMPPRGDSVLLRIRGDEIETSWGARFPIEHGRKAFPLIARIRERGEEWKSNGHSIHLGHYAIDRVTADGTVYAGCHVVRWEQIERVARELGLLPGLRLVSSN